MVGKVCVVGAGPCGLTTLKNLAETGVTDVVCYEAGSRVGGNWVLDDDRGHSSIYETTHTISSKSMMGYRGFPIPRDYPEYPCHQKMLSYFEQYAERFDVLRFIQFQSEVQRIEPAENGQWSVTISENNQSRTEIFEHVLVCSGHHWDPLIPDLPGTYSGRQLHAHDYKTAEPFRGSKVLVVGGGNTACDIAVETSRISEKTDISMRRGQYIIPKFIYGMPVDVAYHRLRRLPKPLRQWAMKQALRVAIGRFKKYKLQEPECGVMEMHPTLNSDILNLIRHGKIHPRRGIQDASGDTITFTDGKTGEYDTIVWATGYRISYPFLDSGILNLKPGERLPLYLKMMPENVPNLYFIGLFQPIGCIWTLADYQARVAALQISGRLERRNNIAELIDREVNNPHWQFQPGLRHVAEVDVYDFKAELMAEIARAEP